MPAWFIFTGHPPSKQNLISEGEDAYVEGVGRWPRDAAKAVADASAEFLRQTQCFREITHKEFVHLTQPEADPTPTPTPTPPARPKAAKSKGAK